MTRLAQQILDEARQLPPDQQQWLAENLLAGSEEEFAAWQRAAGEPEPGYDEWFRAGVEAALADDTPDVSHEEAMQTLHRAIEKARQLKATA